MVPGVEGDDAPLAPCLPVVLLLDEEEGSADDVDGALGGFQGLSVAEAFPDDEDPDPAPLGATAPEAVESGWGAWAPAGSALEGACSPVVPGLVAVAPFDPAVVPGSSGPD